MWRSQHFLPSCTLPLQSRYTQVQTVVRDLRKSSERWDHRGNALVSLAPKHPRSSHQLKPEQHIENICAVHNSTAGLNHISRALAGLLKRSFVLRGACFPPHKTSPVTRSVLSIAERKTCSRASLAEAEVRRLVMKREKVEKGRGWQCWKGLTSTGWPRLIEFGRSNSVVLFINSGHTTCPIKSNEFECLKKNYGVEAWPHRKHEPTQTHRSLP